MRILLEIGMEEIPASFLKPALKNIEKEIRKNLQENRIAFEDIKTYGTPRRMILTLEGVAKRQEDLNTVNTGPAKRVAYDENGELTRAGMGFVKSQGADLSNIEILETPKGEYIAVRKFVEGRETKELLADMLKNLIEGLSFPKSMKWSDKQMRFARPIKWFLAMADNELVEFEIEGIKSGLSSRGHRFFGSEFTVSSIDEYFTKIRENNVIIDIDERKNLIKSLIEEKCTTEDEIVRVDEDLLEEVTNLIEYPYPIIGTFNSEFLEVPQDVLIISMKVHQRYFPILDKNGKLLPKFVVIRNGIEHSDHVRIGNEKVLSARLSDARFFYQEDQKKPLEENVEKLKSVVFQKDLGTIYNKIERSKKVATSILEKLGKTSELESVLRTIHLAKADLVSNMIGEKEFTKLQGFMGAEYALKSGETEAVGKGIEEHYYPRYQGDILPKGIEGIVAGISDRLDTLVGCFGINLIPSGSKDPFALRRAALAIVNIILDSKLDISIEELLEVTLDALEADGRLKRDRAEVLADLREFFKQRVINVLQDNGYRRDVIAAVVEVECDNLLETIEKIETLTEVASEEEFNNLVLLLKRVANISKDHSEVEVDEALLSVDQEKTLFTFFKSFELKAEIALEKKNYKTFFEGIVEGRETINSFFDNVMVNDKDEAVKNNRLSLLTALDTLFNKVAKLELIEAK